MYRNASEKPGNTLHAGVYQMLMPKPLRQICSHRTLHSRFPLHPPTLQALIHVVSIKIAFRLYAVLSVRHLAIQPVLELCRLVGFDGWLRD